MSDLELFEYQVKGAAFLYDHKTAMLADQPGLGKTPQAICAAAAASSARGGLGKICVVAPRAALTNWRREFVRWWPRRDLLRDQLWCINYDLLALDGPDREAFEHEAWGLIIADEAHRLKSSGAKRAQAVYRKAHQLLKDNSDFRMWLLTGTPAKNHAGELWTHLRTLRPDLIADRSGRPMSQEQFESLYCEVFYDERGDRRIRGSKNTKELRERIEPFFLRRMKKDVQSQLPELIFDDYPIDPPPGVNVPKAVHGGPRNLEGKTWDDILDTIQRDSKNLSAWRRQVAELKIPLVKEYVENELEVPGEKMIVFYHHTVLGKSLHHLLAAYQPVIVNGATADAQAEVDTFNTDPNCRVFIGQISACQEALNITGATHVALAEASWSPSDNYQAACRAHRIGMGKSLTVRFLSLAKTPDEIVQRTLTRKAAELAELFD